MPKLRESNKKYFKRDIKGSYNFTRLQFNFSFLTANSEYNFSNKKINKNIKADILDRLCELSANDIMAINAQGKKRGFEFIEDKRIAIRAVCNPSFFRSEYIKEFCPAKYCIFRLYPNNNPFAARILGRLINGAFYIHFIDLDHECYK